MTEQEKREKVIKALEHCIADNCDLCPYDENVDCPGFDPTPKALLADVLALLKAQEPVKPEPGLWDRDIPLFNCGACGGEIGACGIAKYCFHCGKAVKWDG